MTALPSVEPLPPGTRPTEPGWYIMRHPDGGREAVEVTRDTNDGLDVSSVGTEMWDSLADELRRGCTFIARIYPDRIGQE